MERNIDTIAVDLAPKPLLGGLVILYWSHPNHYLVLSGVAISYIKVPAANPGS